MSDIKKIKDIIKKTLEKEGGASGLKPIKKALSKINKPKEFDLVKTLNKMGNVKQHKHDDYILTPLTEVSKQIFEVLTEKLCKKGKAYVARRKAAGEKHGAYLIGIAVKVCKGQMSVKKKKKNEELYEVYTIESIDEIQMIEDALNEEYCPSCANNMEEG